MLRRKIGRDDYEKLSETLQEQYEEKNGEWLLQVDEAKELLNTVAAVRKERDELQAKLDEQARLAQRQKDLDAGNFDKLLAEEREAFTKQQKQLETILQTERQQLAHALIDKEAALAVAASNGNATLLVPYVKANTKLRELDGRQVAVVVDAKGEPRLKAGATTATDYLSIGEYVTELKASKDFAGAFSGTGSSGTGGPAATHGSKQKGQYTPTEGPGGVRIW